MAKIILCASASAALHKACDLASRLTQLGYEVPVLLTQAAAELVSPQLFEALTGSTAQSTEFGEQRTHAMDHIELARGASAAVIAPCTAGLAGRLAAGLATDLVSTTLLATEPGLPRLVCPAMNPNMWNQPAVQRNFAQLREDGWELLEPAEGHMACGDLGQGRLAEPETIVARLEELLQG